MNWLDKNQEKILIFTWTLIILTCLFVIFTSPVKAASTSELPYYVNQHVPFDVPFTFNDVVEGAFANPNYNITGVTGLTKEDVLNCENYLLICNYYSSPRYMTFSYHILIENNYSISLSNNNYDTFVPGTDTVNLTFNGYNQNLGKYITLGVLYNAEVYTWQNSGFGYNNFSTVKVFDSNNNYPLQYPFAIKQDFVIGNDNLPVLANYNGPVDNSGHASPPVDENGHYIDDGSGNRIPKPNLPQIIGHTPSSPQFPSIDTSSIESLLESLIDVVEYSISYVVGFISDSFSNLLSNLSNLFNFVVQSIYYAVNNIVGAIKDLAETIYNNFASLFENVSTFYNACVALGTDENGIFSLNTFLHNLIVPDSQVLASALIGADVHHVVPFLTAVKNKFLDIHDSIFNLTPTKVFIIPSFTLFGHTYNLSLDFSWYDDFKVYGDTIISAFLILGYVHWVFLNLSNTLRGGSSIGEDLTVSDHHGGRKWLF